jgi:hypothetical protein
MDVKESIHLLGDIIPAYETSSNSLSLILRFQQRSIKYLAVVISTQPQSIYDAYFPLHTSADSGYQKTYII